MKKSIARLDWMIGNGIIWVVACCFCGGRHHYPFGTVRWFEAMERDEPVEYSCFITLESGELEFDKNQVREFIDKFNVMLVKRKMLGIL